MSYDVGPWAIVFKYVTLNNGARLKSALENKNDVLLISQADLTFCGTRLSVLRQRRSIA